MCIDRYFGNFETWHLAESLGLNHIVNFEEANDEVERKKKRKKGKEAEEILKVAWRLTLKVVFISYDDLFSAVTPLDSKLLLYLQGKKIKELELGWEEQ